MSPPLPCVFWVPKLISSYAYLCVIAASLLASACEPTEVLTLFTGHVGLGVPLVAMLGSDTVRQSDPTASICGVASCIVLDVLQTLVKDASMRRHFRRETQIIPMLIGALRLLAEKNENADHALSFHPNDPLGSVGYFSRPELDAAPLKSQYPKFKYYRPSYSSMGSEEDAHNLNIANEWSALRCSRSQPLVLERCAVLLWTFAKVKQHAFLTTAPSSLLFFDLVLKDHDGWMALHRQGGVELSCSLMRCSLWPLAARLGCILVTVLATSNRRAKLAFVHAGAHRLLQQHLLLGHHEVC